MNPFAVFRFAGEVVQLTEHQWLQALADGRLCRCGKCLACRAVEYANENDWLHARAAIAKAEGQQ